jgi:hypothetical protein
MYDLPSVHNAGRVEVSHQCSIDYDVGIQVCKMVRLPLCLTKIKQYALKMYGRLKV